MVQDLTVCVFDFFCQGQQATEVKVMLPQEKATFFGPELINCIREMANHPISAVKTCMSMAKVVDWQMDGILPADGWWTGKNWSFSRKRWGMMRILETGNFSTHFGRKPKGLLCLGWGFHPVCQDPIFVMFVVQVGNTPKGLLSVFVSNMCLQQSESIEGAQGTRNDPSNLISFSQVGSPLPWVPTYQDGVWLLWWPENHVCKRCRCVKVRAGNTASSLPCADWWMLLSHPDLATNHGLAHSGIIE